mmetsp:Transcript_10368/g.13482  ORF Transcript_10368/g.13482 Transcript_10368/m.13482 type:complete len:266 (+) Transcript_10368:446-1243(+)
MVRIFNFVKIPNCMHHVLLGHKILRSGERGKDKRKRKPRTCRVCLQDCPNNASCHGRHPRGRHNCACTNEEKSNSNSKNVRIVNMNVQRIEGTSNSISAAYTGIDMAIPDQVDSSLLASSSSAFSTAKSSKQPKRKRKREESQSQLISVSGKRQKVSINHHNNSSSGSKSVELDDSKVRGKDKQKRKRRNCRTCLATCERKDICPGRHPRGRHNCQCTTSRIRGAKSDRKPRTCRKCAIDCINRIECPGRFPRGQHNCHCTGAAL